MNHLTTYEHRVSSIEYRATSYANRRNTPKTHRPTNKPPNQPKLSTNYEVIITNKANLPDTQMNVKSIHAVDYENIANWKLCENKPNSNPIKANLLNARMNVNIVITKDYENNSNLTLFENKPNTNPTCRGVASGEAGSNPISKEFPNVEVEVADPAFRGRSEYRRSGLPWTESINRTVRSVFTTGQ